MPEGQFREVCSLTLKAPGPGRGGTVSRELSGVIQGTLDSQHCR